MDIILDLANMKLIWLSLGILLLILELILTTNLWLLFLGIGAICNIGILYLYPSLNISAQILSFCIISFACFLFIWKPIRKFSKTCRNKNVSVYFDLVGSKVEVYSAQISKGQAGQISWSGTIMNAKLASSETKTALAGDHLYVIEIRGNTVICASNR